MNNITQTIRELIHEVFSENDYLSDDDMAFLLLDSIRVTALEDMKSDFKPAVRETLKYKLRSLASQDDHLYSNRQLQPSYVEKLVNKTLELLSLKIMNSNITDKENSMGEFLYEGYALIESGRLVFNEIFLKESIGMKYIISGKVVSKRIQKGKEDKYFAYLTIDDFNDGPKLNLLVSSKLYQDYKNELNDIEGKSKVYMEKSNTMTFLRLTLLKHLN